jgi:hypothetical protein
VIAMPRPAGPLCSTGRIRWLFPTEAAPALQQDRASTLPRAGTTTAGSDAAGLTGTTWPVANRISGGAADWGSAPQARGRRLDPRRDASGGSARWSGSLDDRASISCLRHGMHGYLARCLPEDRGNQSVLCRRGAPALNQRQSPVGSFAAFRSVLLDHAIMPCWARSSADWDAGGGGWRLGKNLHFLAVGPSSRAVGCCGPTPPDASASAL